MKTSQLSYKQIEKKYAISRNRIQFEMLNYFHIPHNSPTFDAMEFYYLHHMNGATFNSLIYEGKFDLHKIPYAIIYQGCNAYEVKKSQEIQLSFRKAYDDLNLEPIVIIRVKS